MNSSFVHWFAARIAPPARSRTEELEIAAVGMAVLLMAVVAGAGALMGAEPELHLTQVLLVALCVVDFLALVALRRGLPHERVADVAIASLFIVFAVVTIGSAGTRLGMLFAGALIPPVAGLLRNNKAGLAWLALVLVVGSVGLQLGVNGVEMPLRAEGFVVPLVLPVAFVLIALLFSGLFTVQGYVLAEHQAEAVAQVRLRTLAEQRTTDLAGEFDRLRVLSGGIAHDFNNILCAIRGNAELAALDATAESDLAESLLEIRLSADRAAAVVGDLLVFAGRESARLERIDLRSLVDEVFATTTPGFAARVQFELVGSEASAPAPVWVNASTDQLTAAVASLIRNAAESIEGPAGQVRVRVGIRKLEESEKRQCIRADTIRAGEFAFVEVVDSGRGIAAEHQRRIFDPLFTTKQQGRGLGLAVVAKSVETHGGTVRVERQEKGTLFELLLPHAAAPDRGEAPQRPAGLGLEGLRVLLVDDDSSVRRVASRMLGNNGAEVIEAGSGREALELMRTQREPVDIVVLDLAMPGLDGEETLHALRELCPGLPGLVISGHATSEFDHLRELADVATLRKPFSLPALAAAVADLTRSES